MSDIAPPILMQWDGEHMTPATRRSASEADKHFVVGQRYRMVEEQERSGQSHRHEFAWLREAWNSLSEDLADQYPSPEHLRKKGLIAKGHCTMTQHACKSEAEAERLEAAVTAHVDTYAVVRRRGAVVTVYEAVSQSYHAMGAKMFQKSKTDLLEFVGDLIGVDPTTLSQQDEAA